MGYSEAGRSQVQNRRDAFQKCVESTEFQVWLKVEVGLITGEVQVDYEVAGKWEKQ